MVRLRLRKVGSRHQNSFRLVAADREHPRDGRFLEELGFYNPRTHPSTIVLNEAKIYVWLKNGAQPSDSVVQLFKQTGTLDRFTRLKAGEPVEALLAEAETALKSRAVNPSTTVASTQRRNKLSKRQLKKAQGEAAG